MEAQELLSQVRDTMTVKRVFGEPYERDGVTVIPVAKIGGGGGGGGGEGGEQGRGSGRGYGVGLGLGVEPAGAYVIQNGGVRWMPAIDPGRVVVRLATPLLLVAWQFLRLRAKSR